MQPYLLADVQNHASCAIATSDLVLYMHSSLNSELVDLCVILQYGIGWQKTQAALKLHLSFFFAPKTIDCWVGNKSLHL